MVINKMEMNILKSEIRGERKHNRITFNPSKISMGEKLYITLPSLDRSLSIVPGSTNLIYNLKNSNTKSWPLNNLNRLFIQGLQVKLGRDIIYDNTAESILRIYEDLWLPVETREKLTGYGIGSENFRKHLAGSDDASTSSTTNGLLDKTTADVMENQRIQLGQILDNHGFHNPGQFPTKYTITLPDKSETIGDKQSGQAVGNFTLDNLQLEYDTVQNSEEVEKQYDALAAGKTYILHHTSSETISTWDKDATLINENLHINRESMKAVIFLFKYVDQIMDETYIYPNITEVNVTINGKPNIIHSDPMLRDDFEREANRYFQGEMSTGKFFSTAFSVVVDFRPTNRKMRYNDGVKVDGNSGIQVTFKRKATSKDVKCYIFVVSDSIVQMDGSGFQKTII